MILVITPASAETWSFNWDPANPVLTGIPGTWEEVFTDLDVVKNETTYHMYYSAEETSSRGQIGLAVSYDGVTFSRVGAPVLRSGEGLSFENWIVQAPRTLVMPDGTFRLWYTGFSGCCPLGQAIGEASSFDGIWFQRSTANPQWSPGDLGRLDQMGSVIFDPEDPDVTRLYKQYVALRVDTTDYIGVLTSPDGEEWVWNGFVLEPGAPGEWDAERVISPRVLKYQGKYLMLYRANHTNAGIAVSQDGMQWIKRSETPLAGIGHPFSNPAGLIEGDVLHLWYVNGFKGDEILHIWSTIPADIFDVEFSPPAPTATPRPTDTPVPTNTPVPTPTPFVDESGWDFAGDPANPVITGVPETWEHVFTQVSAVKFDGQYHLYYAAEWPSSRGSIGLATAGVPDGPFAKFPVPVLEQGEGLYFENWIVQSPRTLVEDSGLLRMWYTGFSGCCPLGQAIGGAASSDGVAFERSALNPQWSPGGLGELNQMGSVILDPDDPDEARRYKQYVALRTGDTSRIGLIMSPDGSEWTWHGFVLEPGDPGEWDASQVINPLVLKYQDGYLMLYRVAGSIAGFAVSADGIQWVKRYTHPIASIPAPFYNPGGLIEGNVLHLWYIPSFKSSEIRHTSSVIPADIFDVEFPPPLPTSTPRPTDTPVPPTPTPTPEIRLAGSLSGGLVTPGHGDTATEFIWSVDYTSPSGEDPVGALVLVDGIPYQMDKVIEGGLTDTYQMGPMQLSEGSHDYWFEFTDSGGYGRFPESPAGRLFGPVVSDGSLPVIAIDLDASTEGIEENMTRTKDRTYEGVVRLLSFPAGGGYSLYALQLEGSPCLLCDASTTPGDHLLDAAMGTDISDQAECRTGRALITTTQIFQEAPAELFRFRYCVSGDLDLVFRTDSPSYGIGAMGVAYLLQDDDVIYNSAFVKSREPEPFDVVVTSWVEPSDPGTLDDLECVTQVDNLGGYENLTTSYRWFRNGSEITDPLEVDGQILPVTGPVLSHHYTARYDNLYCIAEVTDGWDAVSATTAGVTVQNSPPAAPVVEIRPAEPMPGEDLGINILVYSTDPDGDDVAYRIDWSESEDGGATWIDKVELRNLAFISGLYLQEGDLWRVEVTPYEVATGKANAGAAGVEGEAGWDQVYVGENSDPVVWIENPGSGNAVAAPEVLVAWQAEDADGDPVTVDLYYDADGVKGGAVLIGSGLPASGSLLWTPPGVMKQSAAADLSGNGTIDGEDLFVIASRWLEEPSGPRYRIFARAYDSKLAVGDAMSDGEVIAAGETYAGPSLLAEVKGAWHKEAP